jgi:hypothetical protein
MSCRVMILGWLQTDPMPGVDSPKITQQHSDPRGVKRMMSNFYVRHRGEPLRQPDHSKPALRS